jgi:hypothetical protein
LRLIPITNCLLQIFAWLMTKSFHKMNRKYKTDRDSQKGKIKQTNKCHEHAIAANELVNRAMKI